MEIEKIYKLINSSNPDDRKLGMYFLDTLDENIFNSFVSKYNNSKHSMSNTDYCIVIDLKTDNFSTTTYYKGTRAYYMFYSHSKFVIDYENTVDVLTKDSTYWTIINTW